MNRKTQRKTGPNSRVMAAVAEEDPETKLCGNCKKEIPAANFTIHEVHCSRNIEVCYICKESFPKSELRNHHEQEHTQVFCKCSMKMDRGLLQEHVASECPLRPVACQHCDIELAFNKLREHEDYCGARTERCSRCSRNVMLRDLKEHPKDCDKKAEGVAAGQAEPCLNSVAVLRNIQPIRNILRPEDAARPAPRTSRFPESRLCHRLLRDELRSEFGRSNASLARADQNRAHLEKTTSPLAYGGELDCDLDYLLALSLQQENGSQEHSAGEVQSDFWKNIYPSKNRSAENFIEANESSMFSQGIRVPNAPDRSKTEILLPCEFCEELYPEEDLILHQTGCNPTSALASFSKGSSVAPQSERLRDLWEQLQSNPTMGSGEVPPFQHSTDGSLMLPCEFCGIQLEEEVLFHHQDQCDLRPATAPWTGETPARPGPPAMNNAERTEAPDRPQRRTRHQGEIAPQYLEEFMQQKLPQAVQGSQPRSNLIAARHVQLASLGNRRENNTAPTKEGKPRGSAQTPIWHPRDLPAAPLPARRSPRNFLPSSYKPSFPETAPTRPSSLRSEAGRSPAGRPRYNNTEATPWRAEPDYSDDD